MQIMNWNSVEVVVARGVSSSIFAWRHSIKPRETSVLIIDVLINSRRQARNITGWANFLTGNQINLMRRLILFFPHNLRSSRLKGWNSILEVTCSSALLFFNAVRLGNPAFQRQEQEKWVIKRSVSSQTLGKLGNVINKFPAFSFCGVSLNLNHNSILRLGSYRSYSSESRSMYFAPLQTGLFSNLSSSGR
jgi:hypothetical protein